MKDQPVKFNKLLSVVVEEGKPLSAKNEVVCLKAIEYRDYSIVKGKVVLNSNKSAVPSVCEIKISNLFSAIIDQLQKQKYEGVRIDVQNGFFFSEPTPDNVFNTIIKQQTFVKSVNQKNSYLWNGGINHSGENLSHSHMVAVLYDVAACEVRCYEYKDGQAKEIFSGNSEKFNKKYNQDLTELERVFNNNALQKDAFYKLWDERTKQLAADRRDKDGVDLMDELQKKQWILQVKQDARPKDSDVVIAAKKLQMEAKHE